MTTKLANILHCYAMGMGIKGISATFELSRNTVRKYVRLFQESGIPMEQLLSMPGKRLEEMFGSSTQRDRSPSVRRFELESLLPEYAARLTRKVLTLSPFSRCQSMIHHFIAYGLTQLLWNVADCKGRGRGREAV